MAVLQRVDALLNRPETDVAWSSFRTPAELQDELRRCIELTETSRLTESDLWSLALLFAPTGAIQEVSMKSGWGQEFLVLADRLDKAFDRESS
jgi:hypothetical protein